MRMDTKEWVKFKTFNDKGSAELLASRLESEGVPSRVGDVILGTITTSGWDVYVAKELAHRARWILETSDFSDAELEYLATGKLPEKDKWSCPSCGEQLEVQFSECWSCGAAKPD